MREAIHVHEDEPVEAADVNGAVQNARLAKAEVLVPDVLDGMKKSRRPAFEQGAVVFARAVVGDDELEIPIRLAGKGGQVALDDVGVVVARDHRGNGAAPTSVSLSVRMTFLHGL